MASIKNKQVILNMKTLNKTLIAATISLAFSSNMALADSWTITQTTTPGNNVTMVQNGNTSNSVQATNATNSTTLKALAGSKQTLNMSGSSLTLNQKGSTTNSTQAANYLNADELGDSSGTVTQELLGTTAVTLNQKDVSGSLGASNLQAINAATAVTITDLTQTASGTNIKLDQNTANANTQAVNSATATGTMVKTTQSATASTGFELDQAGAGNNVQAINKIAASASGLGAVSQTVTGGSAITTLNQEGLGSSTQAMNMTTGGDQDSTFNQIVTGSTTLTQGDGSSAVGNGSVQAGNYLNSTGTVSSATQNFGSGSDDLTLLQRKSGSGTVQAGNLMKAVNLTGGTQAISTSGTLSLRQEDTTAGALQAGNAFIINSGTNPVGGSVTQTATVGTLNITQSNAAGSFQAANYVGTN